MTISTTISTDSLPPTDRPACAVVAAFDFDRTLTDRHTFWRFLKQLAGPARFWMTVLRLTPTFIQFSLRTISLMELRERFIVRLMAGVPEETVCHLGRQFALETLSSWIRPQALQRLRWHQQQGHTIVVVSTSATYYLEPWAEAVGVDWVLGSQFQVEAGRLTGRMHGAHCYGVEKVNRLVTLLGDLKQYCLYAYGDSEGDRELLDVADYAYYRTFEDAACRVREVGTESHRIMGKG